MKNIEEVLEELKGLHADMFKGRVSPLYIDKWVLEQFKERDSQWLKRIEEIVPSEQNMALSIMGGATSREVDAWNKCRQEILNKIKEIKV